MSNIEVRGAGEHIETLYGDGVHDDTPALQALIDGRRVLYHGEMIDSIDATGGGTFKCVGELRMYPTGASEGRGQA